MPKIDGESLSQVQATLENYEEAVNATLMTEQSKKTYLLHAKNFVRWLDDDFEPGATLRQTNRGAPLG